MRVSADKVAIVVAVMAICLVGCEPPRLKAVESFQSATTPNPPPSWKGDKYTSGGVADATGGLNPKTSYTRDAPK